MNEQLSKFLKKLNKIEKDAYLSYIANKFKKPNFKHIKTQNFSHNLNNFNRIHDYAAMNSLVNTFFKNYINFNFKTNNKLKIRTHNTETGPVALIEIKKNSEFDEFLKKVLKTNDSKANQGSCLLFNENFGIIIASHKPYSGVNEKFFNMEKGVWLSVSTKIRIEHESTHYCTKRIYGHAENNLHDELVADFIAISKIMNNFKADWFIKFMSEKSKFKKCRFEIYVKNLPSKTKQALFLTAKICAQFLEKWNKTAQCKHKNTIKKIKFLCELGIENMIK